MLLWLGFFMKSWVCIWTVCSLRLSLRSEHLQTSPGQANSAGWCLCVCIHLCVSKDHIGEAVLIPVGEPKNVFELQDLLSSQLFKWPHQFCSQRSQYKTLLWESCQLWDKCAPMEAGEYPVFSVVLAFLTGGRSLCILHTLQHCLCKQLRTQEGFVPSEWLWDLSHLGSFLWHQQQDWTQGFQHRGMEYLS